MTTRSRRPLSNDCTKGTVTNLLPCINLTYSVLQNKIQGNEKRRSVQFGRQDYPESV